MRIEIWSDGSCFPNPGGPGGWGVVILAMDDDVEYKDTIEQLKMVAGIDSEAAYVKMKESPRWKALVLRGGLPPAQMNTNNRMEIMAIMEAFRVMKPCKVTVVTDSQYAIGLLSGRNRAKANLDQKLQFQTLSTGFDVTWQHIHGHGSGNPNVIADLIAGSAANEHRPKEQ